MSSTTALIVSLLCFCTVFINVALLALSLKLYTEFFKERVKK